LIDGFEADDRGSDHSLDVIDRLQDAFSGVSLRVAVSQLERLALSGRGSRRNGGPPHDALGQNDVDLDGGVTARVQDLARGDVYDLSDDVRGVHAGSYVRAREATMRSTNTPTR